MTAVSVLPAQTIRGKLTVGSFTDNLSKMVYEYIRPAHKGAQIECLFTPSNLFEKMLDPAFASGSDTPDVFNLEYRFIRKYVESGYLLDLTDIYERNKSKLVPYTAEIGTHNGRVYALSYEANPGAMFYRRSMAKKYLGTDDPAKVQEYFSDFTKLLETAKLLNKESGGKCVLVAGVKDLFVPYLASRTQGWVVNGKLEIDPVMEQYMDFCKTMYNNKWEANVNQWSDNWFDGMKDDLLDKDEKRLEVFSYFFPPWGMHYVLKTNSPGTSGDWAMIQGPVSYYWTGVWLAANKNTKNPKAALAMIEWLIANDKFVEQWSKETEDLAGNTVVINKIKNNSKYNEPYLGGQNYYAAFAGMVKNVSGKLTQKNDEVIQNLFWEELNAYKTGKKNKTRALADFRKQVQLQLDL
jgi:ABC-type glycerol-3-phosphate transport system substrate-binding protein